MTLPFAQRALPEAGAWRVHPDPIALPRLSHDGPGLNRSDDPFRPVRRSLRRRERDRRATGNDGTLSACAIGSLRNTSVA
jgi:hypothetical protein